VVSAGRSVVVFVDTECRPLVTGARVCEVAARTNTARESLSTGIRNRRTLLARAVGR
jgi:hypothetical protein